jgi:eukaryotic-like serine/threonine-protein kinase
MSLSAGSRLGPYEVLAPLGAGGMGEVYRARDSKLDREVAVKVLPEVFAADPDRLSRFDREAKTLAALNHPHIAQIYGIEEQGATRALVMEFVDGETLADRLSRGPVSVPEAVAIARQIADGLSAAHEQGIIHRDLKPTNIKVRADGTVKILDFGLAKLAAGEASVPGVMGTAAPTLTTPAMTGAGVILGTAAYMSPEQARGKPVDRRADIWAFGVVLYEMLTGRALFAGETVSDTMAEVLKRDIDLKALPPDTPPGVRRMLALCLQRDPRERLRDIGDAFIAFELTPSHIRERTSRVTRSGVAAAVVMAMLAGAAATWAWVSFRLAETPVLRTTVTLEGEVLANPGRNSVAVSPDGLTAAVVTTRGILLQRFSDFSPTLLPNTAGAISLAFAPDGESIVFYANQKLQRLELHGGSPHELLDLPATAAGPNGLSVSPDGAVAFTDAGRVLLLRPGRSPEALPLPSGMQAQHVHFLPDGRSLLYARGAPGNPEGFTIYLHGLDGSEPAPLVQGLAPQFVPPDGLVFSRNTSLVYAELDLDAKRLKGEPRTVLERVLVGGAVPSPHFSLSRTGTLFYLPGTYESEAYDLVSVDPRGKATLLSPSEPRSYSDLRLSPDRRRLAMHLFDQANDIWVRDMDRGTLTRLTLAEGEDETPAWSPDGRRIAFTSNRVGENTRVVRVVRADGTGGETILWRTPAHAHVTDWSRDGRWIVLEVLRGDTRNDVLLLDSQASGEPKPYVDSPFQETGGRVSPDGRYLAYASTASGRNEIYIQPFPDPQQGDRVQVSVNGGTAPVWSVDGSRLFYRSAKHVMAVQVQTTSRLSVGIPEPLFEDTFGRPQGDSHTSYDVLPDGSFIFTQPLMRSRNEPLRLRGILNWIREVRAAAATD